MRDMPEPGPIELPLLESSGVAPGTHGADEAVTSSQVIENELTAYGEVMAGRDALIRKANSHGLSEARISRLMGHSRTTVRKALGRN